MSRAYVFDRPSRPALAARYVLLVVLLLVSVMPFLWQLGTSFKSANEDPYAFPPKLLPSEPTLINYERVTTLVPVLSYAGHSLILAVATVISNAVFCTLAGYAIGTMAFRGKKVVTILLLSTMLLPGEVTLTSQFLTINSLGLANTLAGVWLPGAIGAINVLLMATACRAIPPELFDAATVDGATTWQRIRHIAWPNVRGMVSVIALFAFIGAWDDFLWPLVVLSDPDKYTLTVGMQYLSSQFSTDPRLVAAGTMIALVPIVVLFVVLQRQFFKGVEEGGVKG